MTLEDKFRFVMKHAEPTREQMLRHGIEIDYEFCQVPVEHRSAVLSKALTSAMRPLEAYRELVEDGKRSRPVKKGGAK